jgi:hypothetical protein
LFFGLWVWGFVVLGWRLGCFLGGVLGLGFRVCGFKFRVPGLVSGLGEGV